MTRAFGVFTLLLAAVFACAGVELGRSADPFTAFAPLLIAAGLVLCAVELWRGSGGGVDGSSVESAAGQGGQAPANVE